MTFRKVGVECRAANLFRVALVPVGVRAAERHPRAQPHPHSGPGGQAADGRGAAGAGGRT